MQERTWADERPLVQQELRALKQHVFLFYVKLRWLLRRWRQGKQLEEEADDSTEVAPPGVHFLTVLLSTPGPCQPPPLIHKVKF